MQEQQVKVCWANQKAVQRDVNVVFSSMEHEVSWMPALMIMLSYE